MSNLSYEKEYEDCRQSIEEALSEFYPEEDNAEKDLKDAIRYSLLAGGKRIRPILVIKFCEAAGGTPEDAMSYACAVEMLHTYSLIHDDLPCMDNAETRRGKPANHVAYGEWTATLAGDTLQAAAFHTILSAKQSPAISMEAALILAEAAGENGICGGQYLDMATAEQIRMVEELVAIHELKTAALVRAAAVIGVLAAGEVSEEKMMAANDYAMELGLAFQIRDDMLDCSSNAEQLGKPVGNDAATGKDTFVSLLDMDFCAELVKMKTEAAKAAIHGKFENTGFLEWLADFLAEREQ